MFVTGGLLNLQLLRDLEVRIACVLYIGRAVFRQFRLKMGVRPIHGENGMCSCVHV